jgi:hypothetical protein
MRKLRVLLIALVMGATALFVGPAAPASATTCSEPANVDCTIWEGVICNEGVPKAIRVKAGCFSNQP